MSGKGLWLIKLGFASLNGDAAFAVEGDWHVLQTKTRQEKILASTLQAMEITYFLPLRKNVRNYGRKKQFSELPLFTGYLFVKGSLDDAYRADRTGRVAKIIPVPDQRTLDWELRNLKKALDSGTSLDPYPAIKVGVLVEVKSGPLRGLQGFVEGRLPSNRIIFQIQMLGRAVSTEIDAALLELI
ncbi:MAG TPA: transcription termination/antitermination NusG family protein [Tepidisphaeraceae bacterium]|jgi:transcriptional antiterminator RfaH